MALKLKVCDEDSITIPRSILECLLLREGDEIEVRLDNDRLILQGVADKLAMVRRFRGIWKDEAVDKVFQEIDEEWTKWNEQLHA